ARHPFDSEQIRSPITLSFTYTGHAAGTTHVGTSATSNAIARLTFARATRTSEHAHGVTCTGPHATRATPRTVASGPFAEGNMQGQTSIGEATATHADTNANGNLMSHADIAPFTRAPLHMPTPARIAHSQMSAFAAALQARPGVDCSSYETLHAFSVRDYRTFWRAFIEWTTGLDYAGNPEPVCVGDVCEHATFFPNLELNFADNLLGTQIA